MCTKTLVWRRFSSGVALAAFLVFTLSGSVQAADTNVTGGTNGASCGSGGYFRPSSVTVNSGDTVTISVPSDDPYAFGIQVHGFPEGLFTVLPGHSHTTNALAADVSYYGTWPNTSCMKGSGTITVSAPAPPPASPPASTPSTSSPGSSTPSASVTTTPSTPSQPATQPSDTTQSTPTQQSATVKPSGQTKTQTMQIAPKPQPMSFGLTAALSGAVVTVLLAVFAVWRFVLARRLPAQPIQQTPPAVVPPSGSEVSQASATPAEEEQDISKGEDYEDKSNN